ncbi:MAG: uroporphyrinogen-III C-methyltransferase [Coxiella endosymbiont of Haemaphysalis qinghaiensis]
MSKIPTPNGSPKKLKPRFCTRSHGLLLSVSLILAPMSIIGSSVTIWCYLKTCQFEHTLVALKADLKQSQARVQASINANQADIAQLSQRFSQAGSDKNITEVGYLIRLANIHFLIEQDSSVALQLLKMARQQLESLSEEKLIPLKKAINQDVATLSTIEPVVVTKLFNQLDQLKTEAGNLPLLTTRRFLEATPARTESVPERKNWRERLKYNLSGLKKLFVIQHIDHLISPLSEPQKNLFLIQNIQLKLIQAQWALINRNSLLYRKSLGTAIQRLSEYDSNQTEITALIRKIQTLAVVDIKPALLSLKSFQSLTTISVSIPDKKT